MSDGKDTSVIRPPETYILLADSALLALMKQATVLELRPSGQQLVGILSTTI